MGNFDINTAGYMPGSTYRAPGVAAPPAAAPIGASYTPDVASFASGGAAVSFASIQNDLNSTDVNVRIQAAMNAFSLPPAQAVAVLTPHANDPVLGGQIQQALVSLNQMAGAPPAAAPTGGAVGPQPQFAPPQQQQQFVPQQQQQFVPQQQQQFVPQQQQQFVPQQQQQFVPQQQQQFAPQNNGMAPGAPMDPTKAQLMLASLQDDLNDNAQVPAAIQQLMQLANSNPQFKEPVRNILLDKVYNNHIVGANETAAVSALASMNDPFVIPYFEAFLRAPGTHSPDALNICYQAVQAALSNPNGPMAAAANGQAGQSNIEMLRMAAVKFSSGDADSLSSLQVFRNALGPDPTAQGPARQEVLTTLLRYVATDSTSHPPANMIGAIQLLAQMKATEMDTPRYLGALVGMTGLTDGVSKAAKAAMMQLLTQ